MPSRIGAKRLVVAIVVIVIVIVSITRYRGDQKMEREEERSNEKVL